MIDESGRAREELAIDFMWRRSENGVGAIWVVKLIQLEEVHIFAFVVVTLISTIHSFFVVDNFAEIEVDECTFLNIDCASDTFNSSVYHEATPGIKEEKEHTPATIFSLEDDQRNLPTIPNNPIATRRTASTLFMAFIHREPTTNFLLSHQPRLWSALIIPVALRLLQILVRHILQTLTIFG